MYEGNNPDWWSQLIDAWGQVVMKLIAPISVGIGLCIKLGEDLTMKRDLTWSQRLGIYMTSLSCGVLGWLVCSGINVLDWRMAVVISTATYCGEYFPKWMYKNRDKILNWITFRNFHNGTGTKDK